MEVDVVIIGAGPGGLQLAHDLERHQRSYVVLERNESVGSFFRTFPRHRTLISINKIHTGYNDERSMRFDWNSLLSHDDGCLFRDFSEDYFPTADTMVDYLQAYADRYVHSLKLGCAVQRVGRVKDRFHVLTSDKCTYVARAVVVATGVPRVYRPKLPGLELAEPYDRLDIDPSRFQNKHVLIIGKGNSAFETADKIISKAAVIHLVSPTPIRLAWNTHFPGHLRAINNNFLDTYQLKVQNALLDATVCGLSQREDGRIVASFSYTHAGGEQEDIAYDHVIACTGFEMDTRMFAASACPATTIDGRFPKLNSEFESATVPMLFFAGTLTQSLDYKRTNSAFVHGFRYNARALAKILEHRLYGASLPASEGPRDLDSLTSTILDRINRSSAQWQQFGFMGDACVVEDTIRLYEDLPVAFIHSSSIGRANLYLIVTLEFGHKPGDVFSMPRAPTADAAADSFFLHPVVRAFSKGVPVGTLHLLENLFGEWSDPQVHRRPLLEFLGSVLAAGTRDPSSCAAAHDAPARARRG